MNSFYGGKQGRTYNIVARFNSIEEMTSAFSQGAAYTTVSYGQYVLIDTILNNNNPNDPNNGKIYRRGLDYSKEIHNTNFKDPGAGAIYIGQIQGPEGKIPPLDIMQFDDFSTTTSSASTVIDGPSTFSPPTTLKAWDGTTYHPIQIGYATIANTDGSNREGIIGLDIPQPVVQLNSSIVSGTTETFNLIEQTNASTNATSNGVQYYAYDIKFPIVSNFEVSRIVDDPADPTTYTLSYYSPTSTGTFEQTTMSFPIEVVDKMRWQGDLIQYRTTKNEWKDLYNPNGQFHIYAEINNITSSTIAYPASKAIEDLNSSTQYKYGVRTPINNGTSTQYDITQAGWVLSVELKEEENTPVHSALFAYDYTPDIERGSSSYTLEDFKTLSPEIESDIKPKGWFKVQDFDSSLASDPEQIILLGKEGEQSSLDVKSKSKTDLKKDGIWAYSQKEEAIKWWI